MGFMIEQYGIFDKYKFVDYDLDSGLETAKVRNE